MKNVCCETLRGSSVLVVGGSFGLGARVVDHLSAHDFVEIVVLSTMRQGQAAAEHPRVQTIRGSITDLPAVQRALVIAHRKAPVRAVINLAGAFAAESVADGEDNDWVASTQKIIETNLVGTLILARALFQVSADWPLNSNGERSLLVLISSASGRDGDPNAIAYSLSKAATEAATRPLARTLSSREVRVVTLSLGLFDEGMGLKLPDQVRKQLSRKQVFPRRNGDAADLVEALNLAWNSSFWNGATLSLDGGLRL